MKILICFVVGLLGFIVLIRYIETTSLFFPRKEMDFYPATKDASFEDVYFKTEDRLLLNGWFFKNPSAKATLVFFHGNAGNISHRAQKILLFRDLGLNVFIVDYRGYGNSQGTPSEKGIYKDALAAFDYLAHRSDVNKTHIIGYGESLGGVVAIDLALHRPLVSLIVDSSFSSAADMANQYYPFVPVFLLHAKMDSVAKIKNVKGPKLFIHSKDDEIVPIALGKKLFDAAQEPKEFLVISGDHNNGYELSLTRYRDGIKAFLRRQGL